MHWNFVCFPIIFSLIIEQFFFICFNWKLISVRGILTDFRNFMTFHKVELRVIEIGSGEGTLEVFEVKGGRNF